MLGIWKDALSKYVKTFCPGPSTYIIILQMYSLGLKWTAEIWHVYFLHFIGQVTWLMETQEQAAEMKRYADEQYSSCDIF